MAISVQQYLFAIPGVLIVLTILLCLARGMWCYRLWTKRGFYLKDFEELSNEARVLCVETAQVHRAVCGDDLLDTSIKIACMETVNAADEYDVGIRIALASWEDMLHLSLRDSDIDAKFGKDSNEDEVETRRKLGRRHRRYVIGTMRKRCMEGIEKRKRLSLQIQWMLTEIVEKYVTLPDAMSGALPTQTTRVDLQRGLHSINSFGAFHIPDFNFGGRKLGSREMRPISQQTRETKERSITHEKYRNFSLPSPTKARACSVTSLTVPPR